MPYVLTWCYFTQVLFSEGAEAWREARRHADSELHLMPRLKTQVVFSNSIKKDYKLLPRYIFLTLLLSSSFSIFAYPATLNFLIVLKYQLKVEVIIICLVHRYKLNISLSSLKFNLSQRTIASVLDFLDTLPVSRTQSQCPLWIPGIMLSSRNRSRRCWC